MRLSTASSTALTFRSAAADSSYSRDRNLWHISHEGLELEDPSQEPNYEHLLVLGVTPEKAPDEGEYVTMTFEERCSDQRKRRRDEGFRCDPQVK